ncbi:FkbM family methyltransferase [Sulfitobacter sp. JB4-11]|uniref:FkbM family methyltransferase n=1 Tax=Sulfitobacter rhodophyticola TaxID=3238304 RepID=UPI003D81AA06
MASSTTKSKAKTATKPKTAAKSKTAATSKKAATPKTATKSKTVAKSRTATKGKAASASKTPPPSKTEPAAVCHGVKVPDSPMVTPERANRINLARYEGQEIAGALEVVQEGDHVLELGAGLGIVGAVAAKNGKPAKVMSFEANPNLIPHINALYKMNRLGKTIEVRNEVLISAPDAPETMPFHIRNSYLGSSLIEAENRRTTRVDVNVAKYADVHRDFKPTVLLMDIEGGELDFLRHANLDGVRAIVIEFHPNAYGKEGMRECKSILARAGFSQVRGHCTRHIWTCTYDPTLQPPHPDGGWTESIETVKKAVVVPPLETGFVQRAGLLDADGNYLANGALWRNGRALTVTPDMPEGKLPVRKGTWLWAGVLWMHFGHFLVESTSRLWALNQIKDKIDGILYIPKRPRNGPEVLDMHKEFAQLMGSDVPVVCVDKPEQVERLIIPGQGVGLGKIVSGTQAYRDAISARFAKDVKADGPDRLYISRSKLPAGRGTLVGEAELEENLIKQGYTIYHPQKHDLHSQIATYKAAKQVLAAEGSALHLLAMVAGPKTQIGIVVRRPSGATNQLIRHVESFSGTSPTVVTALARSWKPSQDAKPRMWMGELDMPALEKELAAAGFVKPAKTTWKALKTAEVKKRLGKNFVEVEVEPA